MTNETKDIIQAAIDKKPGDAHDAIRSLLMNKVRDALDVEKIKISSQMFGNDEGSE